MLWVFVCVGLVTLVAALYELVRGLSLSRWWTVPHAGAIVLLTIAWFAGHTTAIGTVALFTALFIEVLCKLHGGPTGNIWEEPEETDDKSVEAAEPILPEDGSSIPSENVPTATPDNPPEIEAETAGSNSEPTLEDEDDSPVAASETAEATLSQTSPSDNDAPVDDASVPSETGPDETGAAADETEAVEPAPLPEPEPEPEPELPQIKIVPAFSTCVLLKSAWNASAIEVFLASLRRGGRREARLLDNGGSEFPVIGLGEMMIELRPKAERLPRDQIEFGLAHSWDWPEAPETVKEHKACVVFTTYPCEERSREDIVLLHRDAHLALAEFAHVLAAFWMDAGRFVDVSHLRAAQAEGGLRATDLCITYRTFPLEGDDEGFVLSDTVGLYAFGLPDFQIVCEGDPDETVSAMLYHLAETCFSEGPSLDSGHRISTNDGTQWDVCHMESRFPPERVVTQLSPVPAKQETEETMDTPEYDASPAADEAPESTEAIQHDAESLHETPLDTEDTREMPPASDEDSDQPQQG